MTFDNSNCVQSQCHGRGCVAVGLESWSYHPAWGFSLIVLALFICLPPRAIFRMRSELTVVVPKRKVVRGQLCLEGKM